MHNWYKLLLASFPWAVLQVNLHGWQQEWKGRAATVITTSHLKPLIPRGKVDFAGRSNKLREFRSKRCPWYGLVPPGLRLSIIMSPLKSSAAHCGHPCAGTFPLQPLLGPGDAPWVGRAPSYGWQRLSVLGEPGQCCGSTEPLPARPFQLLTGWICHISPSIRLNLCPCMRELKSLSGLWVKGSCVLIGLELFKFTLQWNNPQGTVSSRTPTNHSLSCCCEEGGVSF